MSLLMLHEVGKSVLDGVRERPVLRALSFEVRAGEMVALVGPSGSGKSTALSIAAGFVDADRGRVRLIGRELAPLRERQRALLRRGCVGFLFQRVHLFEGLGVFGNVVECACLLGVPRREAKRRAQQLLERLGVWPRRHASIGSLSGGEKQRVALARAMVGHAPLLLCDEPTSALDGASSDDVVALLREIAAEGRGVLVATHDERLVRAADARVELVR